MVLKVYGDLLSQPTRAVLILCRMHNIPHRFVETRIARGEHRAESYARVNPNMQVPGACCAWKAVGVRV